MITKKEGWVLLDHRSSPGFTEQQAQSLNLPYSQVKEGSFFETASLHCTHCGAVVLKNPLRKRERHHCFKCNHYICDICAFKASQPDYIHKTIKEIN